jgi:DNA segregation ATPase FtsK/SpoIIIE-like protein
MAWISDLRHGGRAVRSAVGPVVLTAALAVCSVTATPVVAGCQNPDPVAPKGASHGTTPPAAKPAPAASASKLGAHGRSAKPKPAPVVALIAPLTLPPLPNWPANDKAAPPSVSWNGRDLTIAATNSSLAQILTEVSTATGVKVEGEQSDQRIFGSYGPASATDVLNQLLDGSGYNVLIIGDKGEGTPRELVLTAKGHAASGGPGQNAQVRPNSEDEEPQPPEQPEPPEQPNNLIQHRPFGMQPVQGRTPEQLQQELQQRQQQFQQQQQQQPQQPNQQQPNQQQPNPQPPNE